jgi:DNA-binding NtrC family response regulator
VFAAYGPNEYELLFLGVDHLEVSRLLETVRTSLRGLGSDGAMGVAWYPRDGRTADALSSGANDALRPSERRVEIAVPPVRSVEMSRVHDLARRAAASPISMLILGETGVGKEVMAQTIHKLSPRKDRPLLALNCAGLSETLIESELFGHERGAFTGATQTKRGLLETADGGTAFLDEVGDMPLSVQAKLLRVIETREVLPVGGLKARPIDVRFIAATNRDLEAEIDRGAFRRDLFFRLNGITLMIPPLRERRSEIASLASAFVRQAAESWGRKGIPSFSEAARDLLEGYAWPGNIRELKNVIERALILCESAVIDLEHLPLEKMHKQPPPEQVPISTERVVSQDSATQPPPSDERQRIVDALNACAGNQSRAAKMIGMPRRTFVSKLDSYGIPRPQKGS